MPQVPILTADYSTRFALHYAQRVGPGAGSAARRSASRGTCLSVGRRRVELLHISRDGFDLLSAQFRAPHGRHRRRVLGRLRHTLLDQRDDGGEGAIDVEPFGVREIRGERGALRVLTVACEAQPLALEDGLAVALRRGAPARESESAQRGDYVADHDLLLPSMRHAPI